jgi:hypothetical protein
MARTLALLIAGAAVVLATACGDDDDDGAAVTTSGTSSGTAGTAGAADAQAYVDAMIESFDNSDPDELQIDREQAQCLAPQWVETIGVDRLAAAGIEPQDFAEEGNVDLTAVELTEEDGNAMYDAMADCDIDVRSIFIGSLTTGASLSEEDIQCVDDAIDDDLLRRIMVTVLVEGDDGLNQDQELAGEMVDSLGECPGLIPTTTTGG